VHVGPDSLAAQDDRYGPDWSSLFTYVCARSCAQGFEGPAHEGGCHDRLQEKSRLRGKTLSRGDANSVVHTVTAYTEPLTRRLLS
jgi:hypothetical protein